MNERIPHVGNARVADDKLARYLFVRQPRNDKSRMIAAMGFDPGRPDELRDALIRHATRNPSTGARTTTTGVSYEVTGPLDTPRGSWDDMITVWHISTGETEPRFVTIRPK